VKGGGWFQDERGQFVAERILRGASVLSTEREGSGALAEVCTVALKPRIASHRPTNGGTLTVRA
jgi:hypothetical protein